MNGTWRGAAAVFAKEVVDALRDRRTLMAVFVSSVLMGPLAMIMLSVVIAGLEERAEKREVLVVGAEHAPTLVNFIARQTYEVRPAPADYEAKLRAGRLADPVIVLPPGFEAALVAGEQPVVEVVVDSASRAAGPGGSRAMSLLRAFSRERANLSLALRGVSGDLLEPIDVQERDLASTRTRGAQLTGMLPFFVLMAVLYGALNAALDTTAGERERGSLEPLLMNPVDRRALVAGKWGAVAAVGMLIAVLAALSFIPGQWLLRSDTLQAMFQYGWREAGLFIAVLVPFAAAVSAVLMAVAIRCRTFKEAQATSTVVILVVSLMPLVSVFDTGGEARWHLWVPALAQNTLMTRVLKGEAFGAEHLLVPLLVCAALAAGGLWAVAKVLRHAAVR